MVMAGAVRGFAGFGDALFFIPIAAIFLPPVLAVSLFMVVGVPGPIPMIPDALRKMDKKFQLHINIPMLIFVPIGFWLARQTSEELIRTLTALMAIMAAILMLVGWRPKIHLSNKTLLMVGAVAGLVGGATGVPGAIFIFVFMNAAMSGAAIRTNTTLILWIFDIALIAIALLSGAVDLAALSFALILIPAYLFGTFIGKLLFDPKHELFLRKFGLAVIFLSGVAGLPYGFFFS